VAFLESGGIRVHYFEQGEGQPVLLLHSSASSGAQWKPLLRVLQAPFRFVCPDLYGDGSSSRWPPPGGEVLKAELTLLRAMLEHCGGSVHLAGHSYGGWLALRLALEEPEAVRSLFVIEPIAFELLGREGASGELRVVREHRDASHTALLAGDPESAAEIFIDYWGGPGAFRRLAPAQRASIAAGMPKVCAATGEILGARAPPSYAAINVPTTIVSGDVGPPAGRWIAAKLAWRIRDARSVTIPGAGHFAPLTHPDAVARALTAHLRDGSERTLPPPARK
jgi:pimeloyl-ACP methyl ester carboxylesterase